MATQKPTISLVLGEDLLKVIDEYRFRRRFGTRLGAIRALLELGLAVERDLDAKAGKVWAEAAEKGAA